ncbi:protein kinase [Nocardiopsis alba]|uniref:protein kinase n=1 Tax=Nocardiopsis alba TaxID=53437 RepID=UPI00367196F8
MFPLHPHDPPSVGPYRLRARLGEDAYARVYLGTADGRDPVAVKIVRPEYATDPGFRSAFSRQVEAARGLPGRHVCSIRETDVRGAVPWAAVSRPLGPSLTDLVRDHGPLPADALPPLAQALAQGLADLHAAGLVHGSLWPDGVLMASRSALLADPGLEWATSDAGRRAPHPAFAAPEGGASPATDVFSWAATLCYAAGGVEGPAGLAHVPLQLRGLVDTCLKLDPRLRPSAVDLVRMLGGPAEPPAWPPRLRSVIDAVADRQRNALASPSDPSDTTDAGEGKRPGRGRLLALGAGALTLVVLGSVGAVIAYDRLGGPSETNDPEPEGTALVTDADCPDSSAHPAPETPLPSDASLSNPVFSADGDVLATTSTEGLSIWDWREGEEIARPTDSVSVGSRSTPVFSPFGCTVVVPELVEPEGRDDSITLAHGYDLAAGTDTELLGPQDGPDEQGRWMSKPLNVQAFGFSPDGRRLAVTLDSRLGAEANTHVVDTETGEAGEPMLSRLQYTTTFVDDDHFATSTGDEIVIWNADTGEKVREFRGSTSTSLAVDVAGSRLAYLDDDRIVLVDTSDGGEIASFTREEFETDDSPLLLDLVIDPERNVLHANWMVSVGDAAWNHHPYAWDIETGEDLWAEAEDPVRYSGLALHPDGEVIAATTAADSRLVLLDPETFEPIDTLH